MKFGGYVKSILDKYSQNVVIMGFGVGLAGLLI